eukprot:373079_1
MADKITDFSRFDASDSESEALSDVSSVALTEKQQQELRKIAQAKAKKAKKAAKKTEQPSGSGVIFLGHIPHGFFEAEMEGFFSQFGEIAHLRLSRNRKTGKSRHYAFIEFRDHSVAPIVAGAMDGYMLFGHTLVCHEMKSEDLHTKTFSESKKKYRHIIAHLRKTARANFNKPRTADQDADRLRRLTQKDKKKRKRLAELGIDYEFDGYNSRSAKSQKKETSNNKD